MIFEQIEKFQCLKLSTAQGLSHDTLSYHVTRATCPETCLEVSELYQCLSPKPELFDLPDTFPMLGDDQ